MDHIYVAEDGTIRSRSGPAPAPQSHRRSSSGYEVGGGQKFFFWVYALLTAWAVGSAVLSLGGEIAPAEGEFAQFLASVLPYTAVGGGLLGAALFGLIGAEAMSYDLGAFLLSPLCALLGGAAASLILSLIPLAVMGIWYIFIGVLVLSAIIGLILGGG